MTWISRLPILVAFAAPGTSFAAPPDGGPSDIIAAQIRSQGYTCEAPQSAVRDEEASKADEEAWILDCKNARYRVRLVPDMAAKVEQLEPDKNADH